MANSERKKRMSDEKKEIEKRVNVKLKRPKGSTKYKEITNSKPLEEEER